MAPMGPSSRTAAQPERQTQLLPLAFHKWSMSHRYGPASAPTAVAALGSGGAAKGDLVSELQRQLTRIGCYGGEVNGIWTLATRRAMEALIQRVNARLPTAQPEPVHLALAQGQHAGICGECARAEDTSSEARCANRAAVAMLAASVAPPRSSERTGGERRRWQMPRGRSEARGPTQGRMGLGGSGGSIAVAAPGARRHLADQGSCTHHRAGRRHRTFVLHKPPHYLRPMRPMAHAHRRPWGAFLPHCLDGEALPTGRVESIRCSCPELRDTGRAAQHRQEWPRPQ